MKRIEEGDLVKEATTDGVQMTVRSVELAEDQGWIVKCDWCENGKPASHAFRATELEIILKRKQDN